ncbi:hypothetical protein HN587_07555 [Candidatus Woesearchaeota archaeon]|jgi:DNA-binding NtrC family response regulator|nr:hypothetical protein [Candidatus Woesearchaeota archaeon]
MVKDNAMKKTKKELVSESVKQEKESRQEKEPRLEEGLETVLSKKIKPAVEITMQRFLGVSIEELNQDISEKLFRNPLVEFDIDTSKKFKQAKKDFKNQFLRRMLRVSYGNVSEVAKKIGVDRRSIHRLVKDAGIDVSKIREDMIKPYEIKQKAVSNVIEDVLDNYKSVLHPIKLKEVYQNVDELSKDILDDIPIRNFSLKDAEKEFEIQFFQKVLKESEGNLTLIAKKVGLRYETLLRKLKTLGLKHG